MKKVVTNMQHVLEKIKSADGRWDFGLLAKNAKSGRSNLRGGRE
jgi:hypothetical protein